jgi:signal transduction histidine kinase/ActR/RegA family two-component response regulator
MAAGLFEARMTGATHPPDVDPIMNRGPRLRRAIVAAIVIPIAIIVVLSATLAFELGLLTSHNRLLAHTHQVIAQIWRVNTLIIDHETGLRAYLLTHDASFLEPYLAARRTLPAEFDELRRLVADNPEQQRRVEDLQSRYYTWIENAETARSGLTSAPFAAVPGALEAMRARKAEMDQMRRAISALHGDEQRLLGERQSVVEQTMTRLLLGGGLLAAALGIVAALALRHVLRVLESTYAAALRSQAEIARAAEQANRAKDDFLATLSHELRTPLNAIVGWAHILRSEQLDPAVQRRGVETIHRNAIAQSQLISDLLDVSRIITGKLALSVRATDLVEVIQRAIETVSPAAEAKQIRVETILDTGVGAIPADPDRLQQVVWNLLTNAIKFGGKGGRVQVRLVRVGSHVEIVVADNGPGIPPELLPRVFERFWQGDASTARAYGGLGLGLAIVRHLTEAHGGTVSAANREGASGAVFTVHLPLPAVATPAADPAPPAPAEIRDGRRGPVPTSLTGVRVLAVDDEADAREIMREVFARSGAEVLVASSAREALDLVLTHRPDVLVADVGMPGEDGYALITRLRTLSAGEGGNTPALAVTAFVRGEDRAHALRSGFDLHVPKPVEPVELVAAVRDLLDRKGRQAPTAAMTPG